MNISSTSPLQFQASVEVEVSHKKHLWNKRICEGTFAEATCCPPLIHPPLPTPMTNYFLVVQCHPIIILLSRVFSFMMM